MKTITFISDWPEDEPVEVRVFTNEHFLCFDEIGFSVQPLTKIERREAITAHRGQGWRVVE